MYTRLISTALFCLQLFLLVFWIYVALDKLWDLENFHRSLKRQPFPNWWADILFWFLPLLELTIGLLFALPSHRPPYSQKPITAASGRPSKNNEAGTKMQILSTFKVSKRHYRFINPFLLSALLLFFFSIYIGLGVLGAYEKLPCGCASVFSDLSWSSHLVVNSILIALSVLGWYLSSKNPPSKKERIQPKMFSLDSIIPVTISLLHVFFHFFNCRRFPRRFALFPI